MRGKERDLSTNTDSLCQVSGKGMAGGVGEDLVQGRVRVVTLN
jgi:hypothetical protein